MSTKKVGLPADVQNYSYSKVGLKAVPNVTKTTTKLENDWRLAFLRLESSGGVANNITTTTTALASTTTDYYAKTKNKEEGELCKGMEVHDPPVPEQHHQGGPPLPLPLLPV